LKLASQTLQSGSNTDDRRGFSDYKQLSYRRANVIMLGSGYFLVEIDNTYHFAW